MFRKSTYPLSSILLFIIFLFPFVYLTRYTVLLTDDYCIAHPDFTGYIEGVKNWYLNLNGRYINSLLGLLPVYKIGIYRIVLAALFLLFFYAVFNLINALTKYYKVVYQRNKVAFVAVISLIGIMALLPNLNEFFYWYAGSTVYEFSAILFCFFSVLLLKNWLTGELNFYLMIFLVILLNGSSEILIGITNFLLICSLFFEFLKSRELNYRLVIINIISWISTLLMVYAPGMIARRDQFNYGGDFFGAFKVAFIYGAKFMVVSMFDLPLIIFYIFLFLFILKLARRTKQELPGIQPFYLFVISYLSIISMVFILYYAMGTFSSSGSWRASNLLRFVTFVFYIVNIFNLACYFKNRQLILKVPGYVYSLLIGAMFLSLFWNKNYTQLRNDFTSNRYEKFNHRLAQREKIIKSTSGSILILRHISNTSFVKSGDKAIENQEWVQKCYLNYLNSKYQKEFKVIKYLKD